MPPGMAPPSGLDNTSDGSVSDAPMPDFLKPGSQFLAPGSGFLFGQSNEPARYFMDWFPTGKPATDRFMAQYFTSVHPIAPCCHRPSLERTYAHFWDEIRAGMEPRPSTQAVIFAAIFSGAVAMDESDIFQDQHCSAYTKAWWVNHYKGATETALSRSHVLRTTKMETMQAFIMYMVSGMALDNLSIMLSRRSFLFAEPRSRGHTRCLSAPLSEWLNVWVYIEMERLMG
jgi:hypothetical protein